MKPKKIKLSLNKETLASLNDSEMTNLAGGAGYTAGCSDGCGLMKTWWNCTAADCSADCGSITPDACATKAFCTQMTKNPDEGNKGNEDATNQNQA